MRVYYSSPENRRKKNESDLRRHRLNADAVNENKRQQRQADPEKFRQRQRKKYATARERILAQGKASVARRRARDLIGFKKRNAEREARRRENPLYRISARVSTRVRQSLKGCKHRRQWERLLGYSLQQLTDRLLGTMPHGYTWDDFLSAELEIDHIRPISSFNFSSAEDAEFSECWSLNNLQLLPAMENNRKNNRFCLSASGPASSSLAATA